MLVRTTVLVAMLLIPALVNAAEPRISGIYSNLTFNEEAGDLLGYEILILPSGKEGWCAVVQVSEGAPSIPFVTQVKVRGSSVSFEIPARFGGGTFVGKISARALTGRFGNDSVKLRRGRSYWQ
jgi:hypothetical protein